LKNWYDDDDTMDVRSLPASDVTTIRSEGEDEVLRPFGPGTTTQIFACPRNYPGRCDHGITVTREVVVETSSRK
jgi:hypothetical protein